MKIYTKTVIDIESGEVILGEWYEYKGLLALCVSFGEGFKRSEMDPRVAGMMAQLFEETEATRAGLTGMFEEAIATGGVGAQIPVIARAEEASRKATSSSMRALDERLAQTGLGGTPFGETIRGETYRSGVQETSQIGPEAAMGLIQQAMSYALGQGQTAMAGAAPRQTGKEAQGAFECCFIFIATHGLLHPIVRRYRDLKMNPTNRRGYYRLSDRLVPWMHRSKLLMRLIKATMVSPMTHYGKYYFRLNRWGFIFAPITAFWLMLFTLLGLRSPYVRSNSEVI